MNTAQPQQKQPASSGDRRDGDVGADLPGRIALFRRFHIRVTLVYASAVFVVFIATSAVIYHYGVQAEVRAVQGQLEATAVALSSLIDADAVAEVQPDVDLSHPGYRRLVGAFEQIGAHFPWVDSLYVLRPLPGSKDQFYVVADFSPMGGSLPPGTRYDASDLPSMKAGLHHVTVEEEPIADEFGTTLSGYAPLTTRDGQTVALVGIDVDASRVDAIKRRVLLWTGAVVGLGALLMVLGAFVVGRNVREPLGQVISASGSIARGHFDHRVRLDRNDEFGLLGSHFNKMAAHLKERDFIRETFGRYVSEDVASALLEGGQEVELGGEERKVTVLFSDLRGYSTLSEHLTPSEVVSFLNAYLGGMNEVIDAHQGCVIEFLGDGILAVFGAPNALSDHATLALRCALGMRSRLEQLHAQWEESGLAALWTKHDLPAPSARIGVHTGSVVAGNLGSPTRMKYAVIGDSVNVAARLEQLNKTLETELLFSEDVLNALPEDLRARAKDMGEQQVKGRGGRVHVYTIA